MYLTCLLPQRMWYPWLVAVHDDFVGGTFEVSFDSDAKQGAVCLGVLCPTTTEGSPKPFFVHASCPVDLTLTAGDQVYILGPPTSFLVTSDAL